MADKLSCPNCDKAIESTDELEREEVRGIEEEDDGSITLFENNDLFLCKDCKKPLGVSRS